MSDKVERMAIWSLQAQPQRHNMRRPTEACRKLKRKERKKEKNGIQVLGTVREAYEEGYPTNDRSPRSSKRAMRAI